MKKYGRVDANHARLREFVKAHGVQWLDLSSVGNGCPDALWRWGDKWADNLHIYHYRMALVEVKDGNKAKSAQKLTAAQKQFHSDWPVWVITNEDAARELIAWLKR
jgi:hypothetical protein